MKLKRDLDFVYYPHTGDTDANIHEVTVQALTDLGLRAKYYGDEDGGSIEVNSDNLTLEIREGEVLLLLSKTLAVYNSMMDFYTDFEVEGYIEHFDY